MTSLQHEPSAHAPWTRTMFDRSVMSRPSVSVSCRCEIAARSLPREPRLAALDEGLQPLAPVIRVEKPGHVGVQPGERALLALEAGPMRRRERRLDTQRCRFRGDRVRELDCAV